MLRLVGGRLRRPLIAVASATAAAATAATAAPPSTNQQAPRDKAITHLDFDVDPAVADDFAKWLPDYLKELLELPGMLGAKLLSPAPRLAAQNRKPAVVFVLGGPGAGKGTQCAKLVDEFGYKHLSAGDLLRAERQSGSEQGQMIDEFIREGRIVPVEVTVRLLVDAIEADGGSRFLVDGFPRNTNNLSGWHQVVGDKLDTAAVLVYDCPEEVLEERILKRGETSGRTDDNSEALRKRFRTFRDETMPVIKYYEHQGNLTTIDGTRSVDEVWEDSQLFIADLEQKLKAPPPVAVSAAVFSHVSDKPYIADVSARIAADVRERWGSAVRTQAVEYTVNASLKAYELGSLKAFD